MSRAAVLSILAVAMVPITASAQCPDPNATVCAEVEVSGSVSWGRRPAQQTVIVQPAPPPPQGRVVVVQPAPPPPPPQVIVQPVPPPQPVTTETVIVVEQQQQVPVRLVRQHRNYKLSLNGRIGSMVGENLRMGGLELGLRFRPSRIFAMEIAVGAYGGRDYNDQDRLEVPLMANLMVFLPRASRVQFYLYGGIGTSFARVEGVHRGYGEFQSRDLRYVGAQLGAGVEWRVNPRFALSIDMRGFIRQRVDDDGQPEFFDPDTGRTTDTSGGGVGSLGAHFYF
ncbi:MAG: outer membrane beta-barrel protein [Myxococcota bacterium]